MSSRRRAVLAILALTALPTAGAMPAQAQSVWLPVSPGPSLSLEGYKPILPQGNDAFTAATSAFFLSGRMPIGGKLMASAELPFAHAGVKLSKFGGTGTESSTTLGNPYLGVETASAASPLTADLGIRVPLRKSREDEAAAATVGLLSDFDRWEAFAVDLLAIGGHVGVRTQPASGVSLHARGGPILWINTAKESGNRENDIELFLDYAAQAGYDVGRYGVIGGLTGRTMLSAEDGSWQDNSFHHLGLSGSIAFGNVRPGIHLRVPVDDDLDDTVRYVVGLHLTVQLR